MSWNDRQRSTRYSYSSSQLTLLQRFSEADLVPYHGQSLTKITTYIEDGATMVKLVVFKGGSYTSHSVDPGTLVYEQTIPISSVTQGGWNTFNLNTPVLIEASQELWFGIYLESTAAYPVAVGPTYTPQKGAIIGTGAMSDPSWRENHSYSLCILGSVQNMQSVSHYEVLRDGAGLGNTNNISYDDTVSSTSTYHYSVAAVWDNGCSSSASITVTNTASIYPNPDMLALHNNAGFNIQVKKTTISCIGLTSNLQATVTGNFQIGTDSANFSTSKTLPASGGVLYVRYHPSAYPATPEHGVITLVSDSVTAQVQLVGQGTGDCNPPQNLTLSAPPSGTDVTAEWEAPDPMSVNTYNLTWHTENTNYYNTFSNLTLYAMQRFESSDLGAYHDKRITAISFIPNADNLTTFKVVVYKGGTWSSTASNRNAGTLVTEQVVPASSISDWAWNTVTLDTPVVIDATQELWFGIYMEYSQDCTSPRLGSPGTSNKSAIYRSGTNNWTSNNNRSYAIKATVEDVNSTFDHYQIDRNGSVIVSNTDSTSYVDNVGINGNYDYTVWAVWSDGCQAGVTGSVIVTGGCTVPGTVITHEQCDGIYTWNGQTYTQSGDYVQHFIAANGCDSTVTLHLTINPIDTAEITMASEEDCYTWNGVTYCEDGDYTQMFTNQFGCDSVVTLHLTLRVGIGDHSVNNITLYPNPTRKTVQIRNSGSNIRSVTLYDASGRMLNTVNVNDHTAAIDLSGYAVGTYFLRIMTENGVVTKRVVRAK